MISKVIDIPKISESINSGYTYLRISLNNGKNLGAATKLGSILSTNALVRFYFRNDIAILQKELDKQWPFKIGIYRYFKMGNYSWMVIGKKVTR